MARIDKLPPSTVKGLVELLDKRIYEGQGFPVARGILRVYGVPRGGVPVALALCGLGYKIANEPESADVIVDDLIDSGKTELSYRLRYPAKPFYALLDKREKETQDWVVFPWEGSELQSGEDIFVRLLQYIGEDSNRGGLRDTPQRALKAWREWSSGYSQDPKEVLKVFQDGAENYDQMILVRDTPFYSHCEHHLAPFFGTVTIGYIPDGKIVGLSKLSRLVDIFAKRLQVQERLTTQIADALWENLNPKGVGVITRARHLCMESRGIHKQGHHTETSALRGVFSDVSLAKNEFLTLASK